MKGRWQSLEHLNIYEIVKRICKHNRGHWEREDEDCWEKGSTVCCWADGRQESEEGLLLNFREAWSMSRLLAQCRMTKTAHGPEMRRFRVGFSTFCLSWKPTTIATQVKQNKQGSYIHILRLEWTAHPDGASPRIGKEAVVLKNQLTRCLREGPRVHSLEGECLEVTARFRYR